MNPSPGFARRPAVFGLAAALAVVWLVGGWVGWALAPLAGLGVYRWLARQPSGVELSQRRRIRADLPFAADLLAAALRAGAPPDIAARCVADALAVAHAERPAGSRSESESESVGSPLSDRLGRVARALRLGAPAPEAWGYLGDTEGARRIAQAANRSQHSGAAFAGSLQRVADDLRSDLLVAADADARRAGVLIVLPLGLCFLPAFVLAGLVPVLVAILGDVLSG